MEGLPFFAFLAIGIWIWHSRRRREWFVLESHSATGTGAISWCRGRDPNYVMQLAQLISAGYAQNPACPGLYSRIRDGNQESITIYRHVFTNYDAVRDAFDSYASSLYYDDACFEALVLWRVYGATALKALNMPHYSNGLNPIRVKFKSNLNLPYHGGMEQTVGGAACRVLSENE